MDPSRLSMNLRTRGKTFAIRLSGPRNPFVWMTMKRAIPATVAARQMRGGGVHPARQAEQDQAEKESGDQKKRRGEALGRLVDEDAGDAFLQGNLPLDEKGPDRVAAQVGRGDERVQGIADELGPEEPPERDGPEMGGLDERPGPGLKEEPTEAEADDDQEPGPEIADVPQDRGHADLHNEKGEKRQPGDAQQGADPARESPGSPGSRQRTDRSRPDDFAGVVHQPMRRSQRTARLRMRSATTATPSPGPSGTAMKPPGPRTTGGSAMSSSK